jgi:hypothetical protein
LLAFLFFISLNLFFIKSTFYLFLYRRTFLAIRFGCAEVLRPFFLSALFLRLVAAYSADDNALIAASGK